MDRLSVRKLMNGINLLVVLSMLLSTLPVAAQGRGPLPPAETPKVESTAAATVVPPVEVSAPVPPAEDTGKVRPTATPLPAVTATPTVTPTAQAGGRVRLSGDSGEMFKPWQPSFSLPVVSTFSGGATYSYPIEVPAGRGGIQPTLVLNYDSRRVDNLIAWVESDWVGAGWSLGFPEIMREDPGSGCCYSKNNNFTLLLNGAGYELTPGYGVTAGQPGRYYAEDAPQLRIQYMTSTTFINTIKEVWYVWTPDGTKYRFGYNLDSEQVVGYGNGDPFVYRWRLDEVVDTSGNKMQAGYTEYTTSDNNQRASVLTSLRYNNYGTDQWATTIDFTIANFADRAGDWMLTYSSGQLQAIQINHLGTALRRYDLGYVDGNLRTSTGEDPDGSGHVVWRLETIQQKSGNGGTGSSALPVTRFTYADFVNKDWDSTCQPLPPLVDCTYAYSNFHYPRLVKLENGYGGVITYTYASDGRSNPYESGYSYRVTEMGVSDGLHSTPSRRVYEYGTPCYNQVSHQYLPSTGGNLCPGRGAGNVGSIAGYEWTTETVLDWDGTWLSKVGHDYHASEYVPTWLLGREYRTQSFDAAGSLLSESKTGWDSAPVPATNPVTTLTVQEEVVSTAYANAPQIEAQTQRVSFRHDEYGNVLGQFSYGNTVKIANAGFEDGTNSWGMLAGGVSVVTPTAFAGNASFKPDTAQPFRYYQDISGLIPGKQYVAQVLVKGSAVAATGFRLVLRHPGTQAATASESSLSIGTGWMPISVTYTANVSRSVRLELHYTPTLASNLLYIDEVSLTPIEEYANQRSAHRDYLKKDDANSWFILNYYENLYEGITANVGGAALKAQTILYYDQSTRNPAGYGPTAQLALLSRGLVTLKLQGLYDANDDSKYVLQEMRYDSYGNPTQAIDDNQKTTLTTYDSTYHLYPVMTTNPIGQNSYIEYYGVNATNLESGILGLPGQIWRAWNGNGADTAVRLRYDAMGRLWQVVRPGDSFAYPTEQWWYFDGVNYAVTEPLAPLMVAHAVRQTPNVDWFTAGFGTAERIFYDGLGRQVQVQTFGPNWNSNYTGYEIVQSTGYDGLGRPIAQTTPFTIPQEAKGVVNGKQLNYYAAPPADALWTRTMYNDAGQAVRTLNPDFSMVKALGWGGLARVEDSSGQTKVSIQNSLGQTTRVEDLVTIFSDPITATFMSNPQWTVYNGITALSVENETVRVWGNDGAFTGLERADGKVMGQANPTQGTYGHEVRVDFKVDQMNVNAYLVLDTEAGTDPVHRCGLTTYGNSVISFQTIGEVDGTKALSMPLRIDGTWYSAVIRLESTGRCRVEVWERDNPKQYQVGEGVIPQASLSRQIHFHAYRLNGSLWLDNYRESAIQRTQYRYDALGNLTVVTDTLGNTTVMTYNNLGQKIQMLDPDMGRWYYEYDQMGNLLSQVDARGTALNFWYDDLYRLVHKGSIPNVTSPATWHRPVYNLVWLAQMGYQDLGEYHYDETGHGYGVGMRTSMSDPSGSSSWTYDVRGRVTQESKTIIGAPQAYNTSWSYNSADQPAQTTYPSGEVVETLYNPSGLPRLVQRTSPSFVYANTNNAYNAFGQLTQLTYGNGTVENYQYDALDARLRRVNLVNNSQTSLMDLWYGYDPDGNLRTIQDRTRSEVSRYEYDSLDRLTAFKPASQGLVPVSIEAAGTAVDGIYPVIQLWVDRVLIKECAMTSGSITCVAEAPATAGSEIAVAFVNDKGNRSLTVTRVTVNGTAIALENFRYDRGWGAQLFDDQNVSPACSWYTCADISMPDNGAARANVGGTPGYLSDQGSYSYNAIGNLLSKEGLNYTYGDTNHKHAVTARSNGNSFGYDANGNMTARSIGGKSYTQNFNAENRLTSVVENGATTQFLYDGDGVLVKKIEPDGTATYYVGGIYEVRGTKRTSYFYLGAKRVAVREVDGAGDVVSYLHGDHLGSASLTTQQNGTAADTMRYKPYGMPRSGFAPDAMHTDRLFTGQRQEAGLGLYDYNARFYDPDLGRFISADTIVPGAGNALGYNSATRLTPLTADFHEFVSQVGEENRKTLWHGYFPGKPVNSQALNRYSYVLNNPLRYTDPTGHEEGGDLEYANGENPDYYGIGYRLTTDIVTVDNREYPVYLVWTNGQYMYVVAGLNPYFDGFKGYVDAYDVQKQKEIEAIEAQSNKSWDIAGGIFSTIASLFSLLKPEAKLPALISTAASGADTASSITEEQENARSRENALETAQKEKRLNCENASDYFQMMARSKVGWAGTYILMRSEHFLYFPGVIPFYHVSDK